MSDSENRNGFKGFGNPGTSKFFKKKANRKFRRRSKDLGNPPEKLKEVSDNYDNPKEVYYFQNDEMKRIWKRK
jgi:hypothetical protein